jgi:hypothetical protein
MAFSPTPSTGFAPGNGPDTARKTGKPVTEGYVPSFVKRESESPFTNVTRFQQMREQNWMPQFNPPQPEPVAADPTSGSVPTSSSPSGNLVSWGGFQMDSSVLGYAQYIVNNFGMSLSSGYRDPAHNAAVNGVPNSYHLTGRALDFSGTSAQMNAAAAWARQHGATEVLIHNAGSGMHLHVAW